LLVLEARIAVADECVRDMRECDRARYLRRSLTVLHEVHDHLDDFAARVNPAATNASSAYLAAVRSWCSQIAMLLCGVAVEDEPVWNERRRDIARRSCSTILEAILPSFAHLEKTNQRSTSIWLEALKLHGDVVDLNWALA